MCISSVQQTNRNSIEFSLSTQTRRRSKTSPSKFLQYPSLKDPCPKDFTAHYMDLVNCPFYLLHSIPLFHSYCFFAYLLCSPYLLPGLFLISSFLLLFLISIISNSFPIFSNIPYQISCHSIYIVVLLYIFLVILFHDLLSSFSSLFF